MNWKNVVEKQNAKAYVLPSGWDSREKVAEDLECAPERVPDLLRPGLRSGEIEGQQFRVWNPALKRVILVTAYRTRPKGEAVPPAQPQPNGSNFWTEERKALLLDLKDNKKLPWHVIGQRLGIKPESARKFYQRTVRGTK